MEVGFDGVVGLLQVFLDLSFIEGFGFCYCGFG